jgi:hypothetical protein
MAEIILYNGITKLDLPPDRICEQAANKGLHGVLIIGHDESGELYFASSYADGGHALWLLELAKKRLMFPDT